MKQLYLTELGLERLQSLLAMTYRDSNHPYYKDDEIKDLHSQAVSLADDNEDYLKPNYPMPAIYRQDLDPDFQGWEIVWQNLLFYPPWRKPITRAQTTSR